MDKEERKKMQRRLKALYKKDKATLKEIFKRNHRVCDVKGMGKGPLISGIMEAEFGRKKLGELYGRGC